eukprot:scaffold65634_cov50-Cyclotella_meneghiniana.AAC.1
MDSIESMLDAAIGTEDVSLSSMRQVAVETIADRLYDLIILKGTRTWGNTGRIVLIPVRSF